MHSMEVQRPKLQRRTPSFGVRLVLFVVLAFAVIIGQSAPLMAKHGGPQSGGWIEICSDGGTYLLPTDLNGGQSPISDCEHCSSCVVPSTSSNGVIDDGPKALALPDFTKLLFLIELARLPDGPEYYWSACRGPPVASSKIKMIPNSSLTEMAPVATVTHPWSNPWS